MQYLNSDITFTQPIEICEDVGYNYIGISIKSEAHEYVSAQFDTLKNEKEMHDDARKHRRTRRNLLRYRKPRFDNRRRAKGWLAPSLEHKKQLNIKVVETYVGLMPIEKAYVEIGQFDTMLLKAIQEGKAIPEGVDYQKGPRYNLATLREAVFYRDNYTCQCCENTAKDGVILHVHHMLYWKGRHGNSLSELMTCCQKCHIPPNHQKGGKLYGFEKDFANLSGAAFMNAVRYQVVDGIVAALGKSHVETTYGAMTKERRRILNLDKSHANDAYSMGKFHPSDRREFQHFLKRRRNNRILEDFYDAIYIDSRTRQAAKGKELFSGRISRTHKNDSENSSKYRERRVKKGHRSFKRKTVALNPGDLVSLNGETLTIFGTHTSKTGSVSVEFVYPSKSGKKSSNLKKLKVIKVYYKGAWENIKFKEKRSRKSDWFKSNPMQSNYVNSLPSVPLCGYRRGTLRTN